MNGDGIVSKGAGRRRRGAAQRASGQPALGVASTAQQALVTLLAARHDLIVPPPLERDGAWVTRFLDCFAYDPEREEDIFRRVRNLAQYAREGRSVTEMASKLALGPERVEFMLEVLRRSGHRLEDAVTAEEDWQREEAAWRALEDELAAAE